MEKRMVTTEEVAAAVEKAGAVLLRTRSLTDHSGDWYLKVVKAYKEVTKEFVIWLYNATDHGLYEGYYTQNREVAAIKFDNKK